MSRDTPEGKILTKYERLLDSHHKTLPIWARPRPVAIFAALAAFDLHMLPISIGVMGRGPNPGVVQKVKGYHDSLIYAMRCFWDESQNLEVRHTASNQLIQEAFDLLSHCEKYGMLVDLHVGYGRGHYTLETHESQKRVRFIPVAREGSIPDPAGILEHAPREWDHLRSMSQEQRTQMQTVEAVRKVPHHTENGCLVLDDLAALRQPVFQAALEFLLPAHEPPLDDADDLGGFSAKDHQAFWNALFKWSMVASGLHLDATLAGSQQHDHIPTQVVARDRFIQGIGQVAGLPERVVTACLDRLSFGRECPKKPDVYLQPLLCSGDRVAWSPYLIQICKYKRNMLKLMARVTSLKTVADNLIGSRERLLTQQFGQLLSRHGYQFKTRITLPDGSGEIDLMAFHTHFPSELLVTEIKGVLGVDEVNEVEHVTKEMIDGQGQLRNIVNFLESADLSAKTNLWRGAPWHAIQSYYGLVLTPNSMPNAAYDHRQLPAVSLDTVMRYYRERDFRSPGKVWRTSTEKRWLKKYANPRSSYVPLKVGEITYEIPISYVE